MVVVGLLLTCESIEALQKDVLRVLGEPKLRAAPLHAALMGHPFQKIEHHSLRGSGVSNIPLARRRQTAVRFLHKRFQSRPVELLLRHPLLLLPNKMLK